MTTQMDNETNNEIEKTQQTCITPGQQFQLKEYKDNPLQYIEQFFEKTEEHKNEQKIQYRNTNCLQLQEQRSYNDSNQNIKKKIPQSAFHNLQKHLVMAIRHNVKFDMDEKDKNQKYGLVIKIWQIFKNSMITTKKLLHFILGIKNEHKINEKGLKQIGLWQIYQKIEQKQINEVKNYIREQTIKQMKQCNIEEYLRNSRIKNKQGFKLYLKSFIKQLEIGYLKKRISIQTAQSIKNNLNHYSI